MDFSEERDFYRNIIRISTYEILQKIYDDSLDLITQLPAVDLAAIYIYDAEKKALALEAGRNIPDDYLNETEVLPEGKSVTWDIMRNPRVFISNDIYKLDDIAEIALKLGIRSVIGVPVMTEYKCMGVIWILSYTPGAFDEQLSELISTTTDLIASSISRIKRKEELNRKNFQLEIFSQLSVFFNEVNELDEILNMLRHLLRQIHLIDGKAIYLVEESGNEKTAVLKADAGIPPEIKRSFSTINYPNGITWECIEKGEIVYYPYREIEKYQYSSMFKKLGIKSLISVPIKISRNSVGACNFISFTRYNFNKEELDFIKTFGSQVGSALARVRTEEHLRNASVTDVLSGLYNSRYFHEFLIKSIDHSKRNKTGLSVLVIDMDGFKQINDTYGHLAGDQVISEVGNAIKRNVRVMDAAARYGGDEFALILPETGYSMSKNMASRLYNKLSSITVTTKDGNDIKPRMSIGISTLSETGEDADELIRMADEAMYRNKKHKNYSYLHYNDITA